MNRNRRTFLSAAAGALAPALSGLAPALGLPLPARAAGVGEREIVLGTHLDLSGPASLVTPPLRNAMQMRVDEANESGGIAGRRVRLVVEDNGSQPALAVRAVDKLLRKDEVFALLCPFGSGPNSATVGRVVQAGVLCFGPFAASAALQQATGHHPLLFTTNPNYDSVTAAGVRWATAELKVRRLGLIYQDNQFGEQVGLGVKSGLAPLGLAPVALAGYRVGEIDFSSHVARLRAAQVDLIVCATTTRETVSICSELRKLGDSRTAVLVAPPSRNSLVASLGGVAAEGLYGIGAWRFSPTPSTLALSQAWAHRYLRRFGIEPEDTAYAFYGYADWFMQELARCGRHLTTQRMAQALHTSSYLGLASYDRQRFVANHVSPEWVQIDRVQKSRWVPLSPVIDAAAG